MKSRRRLLKAKPCGGESPYPSVFRNPSAGTSCKSPASVWDWRRANASAPAPLAASGTAATSYVLTPARPPAGLFFPSLQSCPRTGSPVPQRPCSPGFEEGARARKVISKGRYVATLAVANYRTWISQTLPHPHPARGDPSPQKEPCCSESYKQTHLLCLLRAQVQKGRKPQSKLTARSGAIASAGLEGTELLGISLPPGSPEKYSEFLPRPLHPVQALPAGLPRPLGTCSGHGLALALLPGIRIHVAGGWPGVHSRLPVCGAFGAGVPTRAVRQPVRSAGRRQPGWCGLGRAVRRGHGQGAASRRPAPVPHSPCPQAGACAPGERGAAEGRVR